MPLSSQPDPEPTKGPPPRLQPARPELVEAVEGSSRIRAIGQSIALFVRQIGPAGPLALIVTMLPALGAVVIVFFSPTIVPWLQEHGVMGVVLFVICVALLSGFSLAPTYIHSVIAAWAFKFALGFPACMIGLGAASLIGYALAHRIVGHRVEDAIKAHPRWFAVRNALVGGSAVRTTGLVALIRLSPLLPFETTNALLAMCGARVVPYFIGTMLGVAPRTAAVVFAASRAYRLDLSSATGRWILAAGLMAAILCIAVVALIAKRALDHVTRTEQTASDRI